jgi:hypothetical protein
MSDDKQYGVKEVEDVDRGYDTEVSISDEEKHIYGDASVEQVPVESDHLHRFLVEFNEEDGWLRLDQQDLMDLESDFDDQIPVYIPDPKPHTSVSSTAKPDQTEPPRKDWDAELVNDPRESMNVERKPLDALVEKVLLERPEASLYAVSLAIMMVALYLSNPIIALVGIGVLLITVLHYAV